MVIVVEIQERRPEDDRELREIRSFVTEFFMNYYTKRCCDGVINALAENVLFVGLVDDEVVSGREACRRVVRAQMSRVSKPIPYFVQEFRQVNCGGGFWNCYALTDLNVVSTELGTSRYHIRMSLTVRKTGEGCEITAVHISESDAMRNDKRRFGRQSEPVKAAAQLELGRIISQVVPGGIASRYVGAGSPVSIVNSEYLRMLGHTDFYDLMEDCGGLFENHIHPDDREKYQFMVKYIMSSGKQSECEYRVRRGDGSYLWVHDIGRRAQSTDGKDLIVSILTDMSNQIQRQQKLERETETDELTDVYNRRGCMKHYLGWKTPYDRYAFFVIDIDNFKLINDLYGHKQGDRALIHVGSLLRDCFGERGIVCRLGGDEFSVFIPGYDSREELEALLHRLLQDFRTAIMKSCPDADSSLSIGGVYGCPPIATEAVFDAADANLYAVKRSTKNGIRLTVIE